MITQLINNTIKAYKREKKNLKMWIFINVGAFKHWVKSINK